MYRKIELRGRHGFEAMAPDAGNRTELSVPDVTQFRFRMEICDVGALTVGRVQMSPHRALPGLVEDGEVANLCLMLSGKQVVDDGTTRVHIEVGRIVLQVGGTDTRPWMRTGRTFSSCASPGTGSKNATRSRGDVRDVRAGKAHHVGARAQCGGDDHAS